MPVLNRMPDRGSRAEFAAPGRNMPVPLAGERPVVYADRIGEWYAAQRSDRQRRDHGLFLTPSAIAEFMAARITAKARKVRVLDPAAGAGILCCAAVEALVSRHRNLGTIELVACEVDGGLIAPPPTTETVAGRWQGSAGNS